MPWLDVFGVGVFAIGVLPAKRRLGFSQPSQPERDAGERDQDRVGRDDRSRLGQRQPELGAQRRERRRCLAGVQGQGAAGEEQRPDGEPARADDGAFAVPAPTSHADTVVPRRARAGRSLAFALAPRQHGTLPEPCPGGAVESAPRSAKPVPFAVSNGQFDRKKISMHTDTVSIRLPSCREVSNGAVPPRRVSCR